MFWAMPRRIRLDFAANAAGTTCGITGALDAVVVTGWRTRPYGAQYEPAGWTYPLSPHYRQKLTEPWLPVHAQPGGVGYRHWAALAVGDGRGLRSPAETVRRFREDRAAALRGSAARIRLYAAGYDMDNAKARGFVEAEMPLPTLADKAARRQLDDAARRWVEAAALVADLLRGCIRLALFGPNGKPDPSSTALQAARDAFWVATEPAFYALLDQAGALLAADAATELTGLAETWRRTLRDGALRGFDRAAPLDPNAYRLRSGALGGAESHVAARRMLGAAFAGFGKAGVELFKALDLPAPEAAAPRSRRKTKEATK